jgi:hypothetical protein
MSSRDRDRRPRVGVRPVLAAALALLTACGSGGSGGDGRPDSDPRCPTEPVTRPPRTTRPIDVAFDVHLDRELYADAGAVAVFADDRGLVVFTPRMAHVVAGDGTVVSSTTYLVGEDPKVTALAVTRGVSDYGAIMEVLRPGELQTRFCVLDSAGRYDPDRCAVLAGRVNATPALDHDGLHYRAYHLRNEVTHRWTFDSNATVVDDADVWSHELDSHQLAARATAAHEVMLAVGWNDGCSTIVAHQNDPSGHSVTNLLPPGFVNAGIIVGQGDDLALIHYTSCRTKWNSGGECRDARDPVIALLSTYQGGRMTLPPTEIAMPNRAGVAALFFDGSRIVLVYHVDLHEIALERFTATGANEIIGLRIPLAYDAPATELHNVWVGTALGPGDYAIVYDMNGGRGEETRLARFRVPDR